MPHKHLHELLREDQEPFQLKNFIADRRTLLTVTGKQPLQLRQRKPLTESTAARNFCINHVCLFSFHDSPDFRKSPFTETRSPCTNAAVFLHVPARTAAMLLDAATRVQNQPASSKPKSGIGLGLLGSFLRRLKDRSTRTKGREIGPGNAAASSPSSTRRSRKKDTVVNDGSYIKRSSSSCNNSMLSSAVWSEKSSDMEASCSSRSIHDSEEIEFVADDVFNSCEKCFCSNPSSPFRFSLQTSPSPSRRKPDSVSPAASPSRHFQEDAESREEIHGEEEEKEQSSPVSVLDSPFSDDDDGHDGGTVESDGYDIECSYASVQRAKHQLLEKLRRFERLAELDPIELEKHMFEQREDNEDDEDPEGQEEANNEELVTEIVDQLGAGKIPCYMKKLVSDLVAEENKKEEHHAVVKRVCKRLHLWKVVELNTIDMMVETDFRNEGWKRDDEERIRDMGIDVEITIFEFLVEELAQELVGHESGF